MTYEAWRISFQSSEQAARSAFATAKVLREKLAWLIYCTETAGTLHVADYWDDLPEKVKAIYIAKADA